MRVRLVIDGRSREIDTRNPRLLAEWLAEAFTEIDWSPATDVRVWAQPSWAPDEGPNRWAHPSPDWITDSRFLGYPLPARSPEEMLKALEAELKKYRAEAKGSA